MKKYLYCLLAALLPFIATKAQPNRIWATYYGNYTLGHGTKITASVFDPRSGFIYVAGTTSDSTGIATPGSFKPSYHPLFTHSNINHDREIFLAKFDTAGNRIWATYYGTDVYPDERPSIAVDNNGNILLTGKTVSPTGITTPGSYQPVSNGQYQPFLAKFNSSGQRLWATYLFTPYYPAMTSIVSYQVGIAVDAQNNVYIAHSTRDTSGIATPNAHKTTISGTHPDAFLMKFNAQGVKQWGTYYGGQQWDEINSLCIDGDNNICALGFTRSAEGIASPGAEITVIPQQIYHTCFMVKFNSNGQRLWGTYVGSNGFSYPHTIIAEKASGQNNIYITGHTNSDSGIATPGSHQTVFGGGNSLGDIFLMKYTTAGTKIWGTYFGGTGNENSDLAIHSTLAFDDISNLYLAGMTYSPNAIKKGCTYEALYKDGFITKWTPQGKLMWGSYYDGALYSITANSKNKTFYVTGSSDHDSLATPNAHQVIKTPLKISGIIAKFEGDYICPQITIPITHQSGSLQVDATFLSYQWFHNDTIIAGATSSSFATTDTGHYYVVVSGECDCIYTSDTFIIHPITGISQNKKTPIFFQLYPNPNTGIFSIVNKHALSQQHFDYSITDIAGRSIKRGTLHFNQKQTASLDLTYLDKGIYFIRLTGKEGYMDLKFVKTE